LHSQILQLLPPRQGGREAFLGLPANAEGRDPGNNGVSLRHHQAMGKGPLGANGR